MLNEEIEETSKQRASSLYNLRSNEEQSQNRANLQGDKIYRKTREQSVEKFICVMM